MHYFKMNIGDYAKKAGRLSMLEHGAYTLLSNACYDREAFPTLQEAIEWTGASTDDEMNAVKFVLRLFFVKHGDRFIDSAISNDIDAWRLRGWIPSDPRVDRSRPPIDEWKATRKRIFERDGFTCSYCGQFGGQLECDHIHPVSKGGLHDDSNLTTSCKSCNRSKGSMIIAEWRKD